MEQPRLSEHVAAHARRMAIYAQCLGVIGMVLFNNNFLLTYFKKMGVSGSHVLMLFSVPHLMALILRLPAAFAADRFGKKRMGTIGMAISISGFVLFALAGVWGPASVFGMLILGVLLFGVGSNMMASSWFSLLSPVVPPEIRGRFFSNLRISWQSVSIAFTLAASLLIGRYAHIGIYRLVLAAAVVMMGLRIVFYRRIPEVENTERERKSFRDSLLFVMRLPGFMPYSAYLFLVHLCTASSIWLFGLLEREVLGFSESLVVTLGMIQLVGGIAGFYVGGRLADRYGNRVVFLLCHVGLSMVLTAIIGRVFIGLSAAWYVGSLQFLFGLLFASVGIASSSELLALLPQENKSLATSLNLTLVSFGAALSSLLPARILDFGILNAQWELAGRTLTQYDTLLLGQGIMVLMFAVTLGLVPSVIHRARWMPRTG